MCFEYDMDYALRRAEEARQAMKEAEERMKQARKPASPAVPAAAEPGVKEPVPA
jgi:F0F1-type ATP synthase membrane subunit b/b'